MRPLAKVKQKIVMLKELAGDEISHVTVKYQIKTNLSRNHMSEGFSVKVPLSFIVIRNLSRYGGRPIPAWFIFANGPAV